MSCFNVTKEMYHDNWVVLLRSFITSKVQHVNNRWSCCGLYCKQSNNFLFLFSIWLIEGGEGWSFSITTVQFVYYLMPDIICAHCVRLYLFRKKYCYWVMLVFLFLNSDIKRNWFGLFFRLSKNFPYGLGQFITSSALTSMRNFDTFLTKQDWFQVDVSDFISPLREGTQELPIRLLF